MAAMYGDLRGIGMIPRPAVCWARVALDAVLSPQCLACDALVAEPGALCHACWEGAAFITAPLCRAGGLPFAFDHGPDALCGACVRDRPAFDRARAVFVYNRVSRDLATGLKHRDRTHLAPALGRWLLRAGRELVDDSDLIVPVPLHPRRLRRRRFNQSALLAQALWRAAGTRGKVRVDLLRRTRATPSQGGLSAAERRRNVRAAFAVAPRHAEGIVGRRVLLVDDVHTTGATLDACARTLLSAGTGAVDALVLARVVRPE
jgi:ComF family protein